MVRAAALLALSASAAGCGAPPATLGECAALADPAAADACALDLALPLVVVLVVGRRAIEVHAVAGPHHEAHEVGDEDVYIGVGGKVGVVIGWRQDGVGRRLCRLGDRRGA